MLLPRRHHLLLASVSDQLFRTLKRRDQVPKFHMIDLRARRDAASQSAGPDDEDPRGYAPADSILLAIADQLTTYASFSRDVAKQLCEDCQIEILEAIYKAERGENVWLGFYDIVFDDSEMQTDNEGQRLQSTPPGGILVGSISEISSKAEAELLASGEEGRTLSLLNLTPIVRRAQREAERLGLNVKFVSYVE